MRSTSWFNIKSAELPVVDLEDKPLGMIDITDILGLEHEAANATQRQTNESNSDWAEDGTEPLEWHNGPTTLRLFGPEA